MKLGFTTLAMFTQPNSDIIETAKKYEFEMIEILGEGPFFKNDNLEFANTDLEICIHAPTVDLNIASLNTGIRKESIKQMKDALNYGSKINATALTLHPGQIGRNEERIRKYALELGIGELVDYSDIIVSVENMPERFSFLGNKVEELERIQNETGCGLTVDVGHGNTCGNCEDFLDLKNISYCHLNDNNGIKDQHITLGEGTLDLNLLKKVDKGIIELNNFDNVLKSKEVIKNLLK
jgi:sugar phosphate isomerase/epimerase